MDMDKCLRIARLRDKMKADGIPFSVGELAVSGKDVMAFGYRGKEVGKVLEELFTLTLQGEKVNERQTLLSVLNKRKNND